MSKPEYERLDPVYLYAPWNNDELFRSVYVHIRHDNTAVDRYRCYELWQLIKESAKLPEGCLLEVGVCRGGTAALITKQAKNCGITDPIFLCDGFTGVQKAGPKDSVYKGGEHSNSSIGIVESLFSRLSLRFPEILKGIFPEDTGSKIADKKFRFCHIDVDVYQSAKDTFLWIWPRLVPGGIILFDDYGFQQCDGVKKMVEEAATRKDLTVIRNLNGHAIFIKK